MPKIIMYTLSTCPWCMKTKKFFKEKNIPFDYIDYDLAESTEQEKIRRHMKQYTGSLSFPFVLIGEKAVVGYNPDKYSEILEGRS